MGQTLLSGTTKATADEWGPCTSAAPQKDGSAVTVDVPGDVVSASAASGAGRCGPQCCVQEEGAVDVVLLRGCGARAPKFSVPSGVDIYSEDPRRTTKVVRHFADTLLFGVMVHVSVEGCGVLLVEAGLDQKLKTLRLVFNKVRKLVPLRLVRCISVGEVTESGSQSWRVLLELEGNCCCIFVFGGEREASYFGGCLHIIAEDARLKAAKKGLVDRSDDFADVVPAQCLLETPPASIRSLVNVLPHKASPESGVSKARAAALLRHKAVSGS
eukprot:CAMPEP_0180717170 /NCGR_PEP_ID=MMETSP1038_2-20121128/13833_1 /TAXON_ID=632150 /ORGANISM="Azadinium spinosum, Strain 3D9" /LENGTH=270 /DNA_ID=CAMNT_0022749625 /DNA_START=48 /DNA_END=857 /DNA_ORIENTATION=-